MNRILEIECGRKVYADPQETAEILKHNYGHAGREFVDVVKAMGRDQVRGIMKGIQAEIYDDEKMQKQSLALSIVLTADRIATEALFKDGQYISLAEAKEVLVDRNELSDNERCYQYIMSEVDINRAKFDPMGNTVEKWGVIENGYAIIYNNVVDSICKKGGFSKKSFLNWAGRRGLLQTQAGNPTKVKKVSGSPVRCVWLKMDDGSRVDEDGFIDMSDVSDEELPFR